MTEEPKRIRIYQAECDETTLSDSVEFNVEHQMRQLEEGDALRVNLTDGGHVVLYFVQPLDDQSGCVVRHESTAGTHHFNIVESGPYRFRVVYSEHFKDLKLPWEGAS